MFFYEMNYYVCHKFGSNSVMKLYIQSDSVQSHLKHKSVSGCAMLCHHRFVLASFYTWNRNIIKSLLVFVNIVPGGPRGKLPEPPAYFSLLSPSLSSPSPPSVPYPAPPTPPSPFPSHLFLVISSHNWNLVESTVHVSSHIFPLLCLPSQRILLDFSSVSSLASMPFFIMYHRTTKTATNIFEK